MIEVAVLSVISSFIDNRYHTPELFPKYTFKE